MACLYYSLFHGGLWQPKVDHYCSALATRKWYSKAYIDLYMVAMSNGGIMIKVTSTSLPIALVCAIVGASHNSNDNNSAKWSRQVIIWDLPPPTPCANSSYSILLCSQIAWYLL